MNYINSTIDPRDAAPTDTLLAGSHLGLSEKHVRRVLGKVLAGSANPGEWIGGGELPKKILSVFGEATFPRLLINKISTSPTDGFQKVLFNAPDGLPLETVIIPLHKPGAVTICLSSQIGCVMGCSFCATARMTSRRNLRTWEIVDQFLQARGLAEGSGRKVTGAVFMGMGEPFLNYDRVLAAAELLRFPVKGSISGEAITVSTVGLVPEIDRFLEEKRVFRLSISIASAIDEKRALLVPIAARRWGIRDVMDAARRYTAQRRERINLAYVCIGGVNTGIEDARALGEVIQDIPVRLDLINVTDPTGRFRPPTECELNSFRDALTTYVKQPVARRYSGGADINAACGTLAGV